MYLAIGFVIGLIAGMFLDYWLASTKVPRPVGTLKMVSDEDGQYLFLELDERIGPQITDAEYVTMRVDISQN